MAQANVKLTVDATNATRALQGVQNKTNSLQKSFGGLRTAIAGIGITVLAKQAVNTAANFDKLNVRLKLLTKASGTFARSQEIAANAQKAFGLSATEALAISTRLLCQIAQNEDGTKAFALADAPNLQRELPENVLNEIELFLFDIKLDIDTAKKD